MKTKKAMKVVRKALNKDDDFYSGWVEHILGHVLFEFVEKDDVDTTTYTLTRKEIELKLVSGVEDFLNCLINKGK